MEQFDIVVVGGGPAGATFARIAGENRKILLLDQNGRPKPCGGLLSPDAQKALARFEITLPKEILVDPQIFAVKTIDLATWKERHYQRMYINLDREKFDLWLRSILPPGVEQVCGRCCSIRRQGGGFLVGYSAGGSLHTVFAKQLVGADGAGSVVRSQCFGPLKTRRYVAIQQWFLAKDVATRPFYSCIFDPETTDCCAWTIHKDEYLIYGGAFAPKSCRAQFERQKEKLRQYGFPFGEPVKTEACLVLRPKSPKSFCCGGDGVFLRGTSPPSGLLPKNPKPAVEAAPQKHQVPGDVPAFFSQSGDGLRDHQHPALWRGKSPLTSWRMSGHPEYRRVQIEKAPPRLIGMGRRFCFKRGSAVPY